MSEGFRDSAHGGPRDWVSHYGIIAYGCTVWSFTTLGEYGLSLSLILRLMKTHSSIQ